MNTNVLTKVQIFCWLKSHQRYLKAGDNLSTITSIAYRAGIHRDTLYEAINGNMSENTQIRLSIVIERLEAEQEGKVHTKLAHVAIVNNQIRLGFGISNIPILRKS
jgi:hypothetical protein